MIKETIWRQIDADRVEPIQQLVTVEYDNALQMPTGFYYGDSHHEVTELIGAFRESVADPSVLYLVRTRQEVYALYLDVDPSAGSPWQRSRWVLHFRVEETGDTDMLVDMKLKRATDFHGHLCPDLVIGYRACQYALDLLIVELLYCSNLRIIVENTTSAVDAVQQCSGCTLGNRRLRLYDYGKHAYTFVYAPDRGLRLALRPTAWPENPRLLELEARIQAGQASMMETAHYQTLLDERIAFLLESPADILFTAGHIPVEWPEEPLTSALAPCADCGELIVGTHLVSSNGRSLCRPCYERRTRWRWPG